MDEKRKEEILEKVKLLEELRKDEIVIELADRRAKYLSDYNSNMSAARENGLETGKIIGKAEGKAEGKVEGKEDGITDSILEFLSFSTLDRHLIKQIRLFLDVRHDVETLKKLRTAIFKNDVDRINKLIS